MLMAIVANSLEFKNNKKKNNFILDSERSGSLILQRCVFFIIIYFSVCLSSRITIWDTNNV